MATAFDQFWSDLKAPMVPNSPVPTGSTARSGAMSFNTLPSVVPPKPPSTEKPSTGPSKMMVISVIGALALGMWWMSGGFSLGSSAAAAPSKGRRRRRSSGRRRVVSRRRRSSSRRRGRKKVTFGW